VTISASPRPNHDNHSRHKKANGDESDFPIVKTVIRLFNERPRENSFSIGKIKPPLGEREVAFRRIECDTHDFL
jgi:hypothetical protein